MTAKERHKEKIMKFLSNPENDYPPRQDYAALLGVTVQALYFHFSPEELQNFENEAYEIRKKNSTKQRAEVLKAMFVEAKTGNVSAANLFLERTEGKVADKLDANINGDLEILVTRRGVVK